MSVYVDTSAIRRLLIEDETSRPLEEFLGAAGAVLTCGFTVTELHRVGGWNQRDAVEVDAVLAQFDLLPVTAAMLRQAGLLPHLPGDYLPSADAVHLAAAIIASATSFVTYDARQARAAAGVGLRVAAPGLTDSRWYSLRA